MIGAAVTILGTLAGAAALRYGPDRLVEIVKEFGGGYAAYWTHHVFHKVWARKLLASRRRASR